MTPLAFAVVSAAANLLGAWAVVRHLRRSLSLIEGCVAFGAGFMLAVGVVGVLPEVFHSLGGTGPALVLAGYLLVHLAQHVFTPHFHFGEETHRVSPSAGVSALLGLGIHTFFDGVAIASGFHVSATLGLLLFLGVFLHKLPEGVAVASVMLASGQAPRRAMQAAGVLGAATVLGVLVTDLAAPLARYGLAVAGGVTLYVAASNLVPEFQGKRRLSLPLAFFAGAGAFFLARLALAGVTP
ncbi:MAG TPA: ZIP family metal transporter [Gemmatimonadales bacterium]|nr:ZIP family metal transporter [Gemmatimonadales bacterium]